MDIKRYIEETTTWSNEVHGPGSNTDRIVAHISKELGEILHCPDDILEWIDVIILALNGASRRGFTPDEIVQALLLKLKINKSRTWPDYKDADPNLPLEHIDDSRAQSTDS